MLLCELCLRYRPDGKCELGLNLPKKMGCREFGPGLEKFCSDPKDFTGSGQIVQMAAYFGLKGTELKKVTLMAAREDSARS
ncbi:MAG: hypothetical protein QOC99_1931 [Acidobacteriota bacterium]|nr:hypothetical protein [Acidobacteriota bacterium]MDT7779419.1 hypothetical protein [Acidobacteriota bacterium]